MFYVQVPHPITRSVTIAVSRMEAFALETSVDVDVQQIVIPGMAVIPRYGSCVAYRAFNVTPYTVHTLATCISVSIVSVQAEACAEVGGCVYFITSDNTFVEVAVEFVIGELFGFGIC